MNYKMMARFDALIAALEGIFMLPALFICLAEGDRDGLYGFLMTVVIAAACSGVLFLISRGAKRDFFAKEGLVSVGVSWIFMSLIGALPFVISGAIPNFLDALFEITSGFTTTGASIVTDVEALSKGILYWRSFSHWVGGMGVLVFLLAIVPIGGKNEGFTMHLMRAESPGPDVGKLVPRMRSTALILYMTYIALTVLNVVFLCFDGDMTFFEALCTAFGTAGTGGFGIKADSLASFSPYVQIVTTVFMLLFGINFSCYYLLMLGNIKSVLKDEELRFYLSLIALAAVLITVDLQIANLGGESLGEKIRNAFFQVVSITTSTGYSTCDFATWPALSQAVLLVLMFIGASAGSTGGGIKCARVILLFKSFRRSIRQVLNPQKVQTVRMSGRAVDEKLLSSTNTYLCAYVSVILVSFLLVSADPWSKIAAKDAIVTNFTSVVTCFNNIGPGLGTIVGPAGNFASLGYLSKVVLIVDMLAGRLEIFPILVLFSHSAWKRH